jgi:hypothetical protein
MLVYESPPELGDLWHQFEKEQAKLIADRSKYEAAQKKRMQLNQGIDKEGKTISTTRLSFAFA